MTTEETCWTLLYGVAAGESHARDRFGERYLPIVRGYLAARWRGSQQQTNLDDATQEVSIEFLRENGALQRGISDAKRSFGAYLFGVTCNVARRFESGQRSGARHASLQPIEAFEFAGPDEPASEIFQKSWAHSLIEEAAQLMRTEAAAAGTRASRRVDLLELRFAENLPIREIAARWSEDPSFLHHEYAKARKEFREALTRVIRFHHPGSMAEVEEELLQVLSRFEA